MTSTDNPPKAAAKSKTKTSKGASDAPAESQDTSSAKTNEGASETPNSAGEPSGEQPAATDASAGSDYGIVWRSGDWQEANNTTPPYNGIEVHALVSYNGQSKLASLTLKFGDFTNNSDGIFKSFTISIKDGSTVKLSAKDDFTISGTVELCFLASVPDSIVVFFHDVSYGLEQQRHHVVGGVLIIPQTGAPTPAAPQTKTTASGSPAQDEGSSDGGDPQDSKAPAKSPAKSETAEDSQQ